MVQNVLVWQALWFVKVGETKVGESAGKVQLNSISYQGVTAGCSQVMLLGQVPVLPLASCTAALQNKHLDGHSSRNTDGGKQASWIPQKMQRTVAQIENSRSLPALLCSEFPASQPSAEISTPKKT